MVSWYGVGPARAGVGFINMGDISVLSMMITMITIIIIGLYFNIGIDITLSLMMQHHDL